MSPPRTLVNTFILNRNKPVVDRVSKIFILASTIFGVNRISIIDNVKNIHIWFALGYVGVVNCLVTSAIIYNLITYSTYHVFVTVNYLKLLLCSIFSILLKKSLLNFYNHLKKFDNAIGFEANITSSSIQNLIHMAITYTFSLTVILSTTASKSINDNYNMIRDLFIKTIHTLEIHYFAHIIGLIPARIRYIVNYIKISYPPKENCNGLILNCDSDLVSFKKRPRKFFSIDMEAAMDLYYNLVQANGDLHGAIVWQMLVLLSSSFIILLFSSYYISISIINIELKMNDLLQFIGLTTMELVPLFAVCFIGDRVVKEVQQLRDILSSCVYEYTLDKRSRTAATAFLELTEIRNLSLSLFHMINMDITLPFKYLGLLFTYLIVLLQFDKLIHPIRQDNV